MLLRALAVVTLSVSLPLFASAFAPLSAPARGESFDRAFGDPAHTKTLYFAVLEGLYEDGITNEAVDLILATDPQSQKPANFVWACPVCMPAYEAFRLYRARPAFISSKCGGDTFGPGLDERAMAKLRSADVAERQGAIEQLVARWIDRRLERMRLTAEEREAWRHDMEVRRKKGMSMLQEYREQGVKGSYASMKECPFCEAAN